MPTSFFISYRRDDAADAAQALYLQLQLHFGVTRIFMDTNTIAAGDAWPARLRRALREADIVICLIGPDWLMAHDAYGRRRLDLPDDWVCREIAEALRARKRVYPVLLGNKIAMPPREALPAAIRGLTDRQATRIDRESWRADVAAFVQRLHDDAGDVREAPAVVPVPNARKRLLPALDEAALERALRKLDGWSPWRDVLPSEFPRERQELRRDIVFASFERAIAFMQAAAPTFEALKHHPRWTNEWKRVTIRLSTWDAGNRITARDVEVAAAIDRLVCGFGGSRRERDAKRGSGLDRAGDDVGPGEGQGSRRERRSGRIGK